MDRRVTLASQSSGNLIAWYYARLSSVSLIGATGVRFWFDRSGRGNTLSAPSSEEPTWEASGGWDGSHSSINFPGGSTHSVQRTSGQLAALTGAFGILSTFQNTDTANNTNICAWFGPSHWTAVRTFPSAGNAFLRVERFDGTTLVGATGSIALGSGHRRIAVSFDGSRVSTWVDAVQDLNNSSLSGVGSIVTNTFSIGWGGNPFSCNARFTEMQVFASTISALTVQGYQASSLINWGA
jgi:hypothetical protein